MTEEDKQALRDYFRDIRETAYNEHLDLDDSTACAEAVNVTIAYTMDEDQVRGALYALTTYILTNSTTAALPDILGVPAIR